MFILKLFSICLLGLVALSPPNGFAFGQAAVDDPDSLVHFGDLIDVDVVGGFEFDWRGKLDADGFLGFEGFEEKVAGHCRSVEQIAGDIEKVYGKILREPKVVVRVIDRSNRAVARLEGAVRTPTRFRLQRTVRLRELIVMAGGLTDGASGGISIFRPRNASCQSLTAGPGDNDSQTINIKISELLSGTPASNPQILSGDMVTVVRTDPVYVIGGVNNPRPIYSPVQMTLSRAIAAAGGLAKGADGRKVTIFRRDGAETKVIDTDLDKISKGDSVDEVLRSFDIIEVATRGGSKRKYPPVVAANENSDRTRADLPLRVVD